MSINITDGITVSPGGDVGDEWIVVGAESAQHVRDKFFVFEALVDGCQGVDEALHLPEVLCYANILLLDRGELHADLHDSRLGPGHVARGDVDCLAWCRCRSVDVADEPLASEVEEDLC
jgi:hypothetical protein